MEVRLTQQEYEDLKKWEEFVIYDKDRYIALAATYNNEYVYLKKGNDVLDFLFDRLEKQCLEIGYQQRKISKIAEMIHDGDKISKEDAKKIMYGHPVEFLKNV